MGLTDSSMDLGRKMRILQGLGLLPENAVNMDLPKAGEALAEAQVLAQRAAASQNAGSSEWNRLLTDFADRVEAARRGARSKAGAGARMDDFRRELADPAREIARREMRQIDDRQRAARDLAQLAEVAARWQDEARRAVSQEHGGDAPA